MQTIETKYIGSNNVRGSRIKATASGGTSVTLEWDDALTQDANHERAARTLIRKLGWYPDSERGAHYGEWFHGGLKSGARVWVCATNYARLEMRETKQFEVQHKVDGNWTSNYLGTGENQFDSEAEAEDAITQLKALGAEWAAAEYRVMPI